MRQTQVTKAENFSYAALNFGHSLISTVVSTYILYYYTDVLLLPAASISVLLFTVRLFDGAIDPFIGFYMDRKTTRFGKFKGYICYWSAPLALCTILLFAPFHPGSIPDIFLCYIIYYFWSLSCSIVEESSIALLVSITPDAKERQSVNSCKMLASILASLSVSYLTLKLVSILGKGSEQSGYFLTITLMAVIGFIAMVPSFFLVKERGQQQLNTLDFKVCAQVLAKNKKLIFFLLMYCFHQIASGLKNQTAIYYMKYVFDSLDFFPTFFLISRCGTLAAQPLILYFARRTNSVYLMISGYLTAVLGMAIIGLSGPNLFLLASGGFISSFGSAFPANLAFSYAAGIADEISLANDNKSFSAITGSLLGLSAKLGVAFAGGAAALILHLGDYTPNAVQPESAMFGIRLSFLGLSSMMYLVAAAAIAFSHNKNLQIKRR